MNQTIRKIYKSYQFITYGTFVNRVLGIKEYEKDDFGRNTTKLKKKNGIVVRKKVENTIKNLNNTVIIVDEAHNVTNNDVYMALYQILNKSYNYRLVLLTGTPISDNPREIFELSNLLNANNLEYNLPIRNDLFKPYNNEEPLLIKSQSEYINNKVLKGGIISLTKTGEKKIIDSLYGKVSYLRANELTNPRKIEMGEVLSKRTGTIKVVYCQMSTYQYLVYLEALTSDIKTDSGLDISTTIQNIESSENIEETSFSISKTSSLYKNSSDASTMVYPSRLFGKAGFQSCVSKKDGRFILKDKSILTSDLRKYSSKLYKLLHNVNDSPGNVFIYSNYVSFGGTLLIKLLLLNNGYQEFKSRHTSEYYKTFVVFDDTVNIETREKIRKIFNSPENKDGKLIKILIGSPILAEGITLKNVRQVHILEPSWNMSRINQIIGRAVRNYSHHDLPSEERTVQIFKYVSVHYPKKTLESSYDTLSSFFIDREKYILSEEKDRTNKKVERLLKEISFDCKLTKDRNTIINKDGTAECDYTNCEFKCLIETQNSDSTIDKSTYNLYIQFFDKYDIEFISQIIHDLFKKYFIWHIDDILKEIKKIAPQISNEAIFITLSNFTTNKIPFEDMYLREGFLINKGPYYIFNSSDIDINSSVYSKILDFSIDKNKYTLDEYFEKRFPKYKERDIIKEEVKEEADHEHILLESEIQYNDNIVKSNTIFGTYRQRGSKTEPYGKKDNKFRIVDMRDLAKDEIKSEDDEDKRKIISGMWIGSYKKGKLLDIIAYLNIPTGNVPAKDYDKNELGRIIEKYLIENNKVLK
jgi:superfamily II DNA or RNA helicase